MLINTLVNIWTSLGLFPCDHRPFVPRDSHQTLVLHVSMTPLFDALAHYRDNLDQLDRKTKSPIGPYYPHLQPSWEMLTTRFRNHLHILALLSSFLKSPTMNSTYVPGHSLGLPAKRPKRGILDFVGDIQSKLWGTATTAQLDEVVDQVRDILRLSNVSNAHSDQVIRLSNQRLNGMRDEIVQLTASLANMTDLEALYSKTRGQHDITITAFLKRIVSSSEIQDLEDLCLTIHDLTLISRDSPAGGLVLRLVAHILNNPQQALPYDALATMTLSYLHISPDDLILGVEYTLPSAGYTALTLVEFQPLSVGVMGKSITIPDSPTHLILRDDQVLGQLDQWCVAQATTLVQLETCPVIPLPSPLFACFQEILATETATSCPLTVKEAPWPLQRTCTREWLLDTTRVSCPRLPTGHNSLILASFNSSESCQMDNRSVLLPATQSTMHVRHVSPLVFLLHETTYSASAEGYHPHVIAHALNSLHDDLLNQSKNWTHLDGLQSDQLHQYLSLLTQDREKAAEFLSQIHFRQYHRSLWEIISPYVLWAVSLYAGVMSSLAVLAVMCRPVGAFSPRTVAETHYDNALLVADWLMIAVVIVLVVVVIAEGKSRRSQVTLSSVSVACRGAVVQPGQLLVFIVLGIHCPGQPYRYLRVLVGGTYDCSTEVALVDTFRRWVVSILPAQRLKGKWGPTLSLRHTGIFTSHGSLLPTANPLYVDLPRSFSLSSGATCSIAAIYTIHDLSD